MHLSPWPVMVPLLRTEPAETWRERGGGPILGNGDAGLGRGQILRVVIAPDKRSLKFGRVYYKRG